MSKDPNRATKDAVKLMKADAMRDSMTTAAAAELLGVSPSTIGKWAREGTAEARMIGGQFRVSGDEVGRLFQHQREGDAG